MRLVTNPKIGDRVKRGPDWRWADQDMWDETSQVVPNATGLGTIVDINPGTTTGTTSYVQWDSGAHNFWYYTNDDEQDLIYAESEIDLMKVLKL